VLERDTAEDDWAELVDGKDEVVIVPLTISPQ